MTIDALLSEIEKRCEAARKYSMAIGSSTGTCFEIIEGHVPATHMLPPCSNQDLPSWIHVTEDWDKQKLIQAVRILSEALEDFMKRHGTDEDTRQLQMYFSRALQKCEDILK